MRSSESKIASSRLAKRLFWEENETSWGNFLIVANPDAKFDDEIAYFGTPLYYASCLGLFDICQDILGRAPEATNAPGGFCGNALQVASVEGNEAIVRLLLEKGAEVNAQGGHFGNALQSAAVMGHEAIVRLLLEKGAKVNAQGGQYGNALQAAAVIGHEAIVRLLLENGAEVNAQGGRFGNALQAAAAEGYEAIVRLLRENGAEDNGCDQSEEESGEESVEGSEGEYN
jgi:ankyrin repeat protein